jgi:hypothetical protein
VENNYKDSVLLFAADEALRLVRAETHPPFLEPPFQQYWNSHYNPLHSWCGAVLHGFEGKKASFQGCAARIQRFAAHAKPMSEPAIFTTPLLGALTALP